MIRRPPRSTLTHAFPTRRSSDLWLAARRPYRRPRTQEDSRHDEVGSRRLHGVRRLVFLGFVSLVGHGGRSRSGPGREIGRATSELQSLMRISYAVFCLKKKQTTQLTH